MNANTESGREGNLQALEIYNFFLIVITSKSFFFSFLLNFVHDRIQNLILQKRE